MSGKRLMRVYVWVMLGLFAVMLVSLALAYSPPESIYMLEPATTP